MKRRNPPITLSTLPARTIYHAVLQFTQHHPRPHTKGRKPLYPEALILTLALLRTARRASYRHLLFCLAPEALPDQPVPAWGTLLYRLKTISDERWHALLSWLAAQGIAKEPPDAPLATPVVLVDGTGVGFNTPFYAQFRRGAELRRIRSHLKAVVLVYWRGGQRWVVGASLGRAYADEGRLLAQWLGRYGSGWWVRGRCWWGTSCTGIGVGCWRVWSRLGGCLWRVWKQGCVRGFGTKRVCGCWRVWGRMGGRWGSGIG
jgi:hypothetical protein